MSKKRGGKKNQNLEDLDDDKADTTTITSKVPKTKPPKKGKGKSKNDDWSDNEDDVKLKINLSDEEVPPAAKKGAKKSKFILCWNMHKT